jgi:PelA/Pel-15E family pectate lyase
LVRKTVRKTIWPIWLLLSGVPAASFAAVIGHMAPPEPLTDARIATLPVAEQAPWRAYLARSRALAAQDEKTLAFERAALASAAPADPPEVHNGSASMPLKRASAWYGTPEARHVADEIVSFQTPAGGWGKNTDRSGPLRQRGQNWVINGHTFVGTIDNDATLTELRFLARVQAQVPGAQGQAYRDAFLKGVRYLLDSQYPNGGFPQVYPLEGGYHDAVTFNDDAMVGVAQVLAEIAGRQGDYGFVPPQVAQQARDALNKEIRLVVSTQVPVKGVRTAWDQQYDALTLAPVGARNFEPPALASHESATLLMFLMAQPDPSPDVAAAVHAGAGWLRQVALRDIDWTATTPEAGRQRIAKPGAGPIWSRYYDIATMKPIFGDRDRSIHDDVNELSLERRNGYSWYGTRPAQVLAAYADWARTHPLTTPAVGQ